MNKPPKLNLETPDFSKAKLPLGEESVSVKIDPKLTLDSEPMGLAQKLVSDLEKAYENPAIQAYIEAEEERLSLINASIEKWNEPSMQNAIREYEKLLKSPTLSVALEKSEEFDKYKSLFSSSLASNNLDTAKKALESISPHLKPEYSATKSALEQLLKTIESPSIQSSLSHLENIVMYETGLANAAASIAQDENLLKSSQRLNEIGKSIVNDSFQQRMNKHATANLHIPPTRNFEIPKSPLLEHSKQIVEQNDQLIETTKLQNDILKDIAVYMSLQNSYTDQSVKELERQNDQIEDQIEQKEYEIEQNSEATKHTLWIAIASIAISIIVSAVSVWATYDVYNKEDIAGNKDHTELLQAIKESSNTANLAKELQYQKDINTIQQQQMIRLNQEVEQMKAYLNAGRQQ